MCPGKCSCGPTSQAVRSWIFWRALGGQETSALRGELLERFDLDPSRKCGTYSKGNRQKVALIAALSSGAGTADPG